MNNRQNEKVLKYLKSQNNHYVEILHVLIFYLQEFVLDIIGEELNC